MNGIEKKINELGFILPKPLAPVANYVPYVISGKQVFIAGQISVEIDGTVIGGRLGEDLDVEKGQRAARACALNIITQIKAACDGDLMKVKRIVKVGGFVACAPVNTGIEIPMIINGCSDILVAVFGEKGKHARFAVGSSSLPRDCAVEIDCIVELK